MLKNEMKKVEVLLSKLNPENIVNYDGILNGLKKANPELDIDKVSDEYKRVLFLGLLSHSVKQNCMKIINNYNENQSIVEEITELVERVEDVCTSYSVSVQENQNKADMSEQAEVSKESLVKWHSIISKLDDTYFDREQII